jgi:hypothetical protein
LLALAALPVACATATTSRNDDDEEDEDTSTTGFSGVGSTSGPSASGAGGAGGAGAGGAGGAGASGSASAQASSSQASTAQASNAQASSSSGGPGTCDGSGDCATCQVCADGDDCMFEYETCVNSFECSEFFTCIDGCAAGDDICLDKCANAYPNGYMEANDYAYCIICIGCYADCDGAASGC